mmetsp:Transcript_39181/g.77248  ORF Transcript_39181/g.77248 Transcript_39181/m.77248 type:complete len:247 (-) Transcript_39181:712-1452(-)
MCIILRNAKYRPRFGVQVFYPRLSLHAWAALARCSDSGVSDDDPSTQSCVSPSLRAMAWPLLMRGASAIVCDARRTISSFVATVVPAATVASAAPANAATAAMRLLPLPPPLRMVSLQTRSTSDFLWSTLAFRSTRSSAKSSNSLILVLKMTSFCFRRCMGVDAASVAKQLKHRFVVSSLRTATTFSACFGPSRSSTLEMRSKSTLESSARAMVSSARSVVESLSPFNPMSLNFFARLPGDPKAKS